MHHYIYGLFLIILNASFDMKIVGDVCKSVPPVYKRLLYMYYEIFSLCSWCLKYVNFIKETLFSTHNFRWLVFILRKFMVAQ